MANARHVLLVLGLCAPNTLRAQGASPSVGQRDSAARVVDSLSARLARAEDAIELLRQQLVTEAGSAVKTRSRLQLELSGRVQTNAFTSNARMNNTELPFFVRETDAPASGGRNGAAGARILGASVRQTVLGASLGVDSVLGGAFIGDVDVDFFAASTPGVDAFPTPRPRLRTAHAQLIWPRTDTMLGADAPLIADVDPKSLATIGVPGFAAAGNLWNWIPQVRLSHDVAITRVRASTVRWGAQVALLAATTGDLHAAELDGVDAGDRAARPALEGRLRLRWGKDDAPDDQHGEIGAGVHHGWSRTSGDTLSTHQAVALSLRVGLTRGVSLRGEAYRGRAIRGLGGGAIGQNYGVAIAGQTLGAPLRNTAGWLQLIAQLQPTMSTAVGCGVDAVNVADRPDRQRNASCAANVGWHPTQPVLLGVEFRTLATRYASGTRRGTQLNVTAGFEW